MTTTPGARVSIFMGKGGVGKTTVAGAFAVDRAARGERVLLTSLAGTDEVEQRLQAEAERADVADRLDYLQLEPRGLVDDLVRRVTRLGPVAELVVRHPSYDSLIEIMPGVRELAILNHVYNKRQPEQGYDRIVLDGPATGHGLHFLEAAEKGARMLAGRFRRRADALHAMVTDADVTEVVIVTLPEEMPAREAMDLARGLREGGFNVDNLVVNKWLPALFTSAPSAALLDRLSDDAELRERLDAVAGEATGIHVDAWVRALGLVRGQRVEAERHLEGLAALDAKLSLVPLIPASEGRLARVAEALGEPVSVEDALAGMAGATGTAGAAAGAPTGGGSP